MTTPNAKPKLVQLPYRDRAFQLAKEQPRKLFDLLEDARVLLVWSDREERERLAERIASFLYDDHKRPA